MTRRVSVQFIAELARFRRDMRDGAGDVRKLKDETKAAQREVAGLGAAGEKAGRQLADGIVRGADGKLRDARGRFVKAGTEAGKGFGDGFEQGSRSGLRKALGGVSNNASWMRIGVQVGAVPATAAAAAASLQVIPPLLSAIGGGLAAIPTLAAGSAASIGTVAVASRGLGDAIKEAFKPPKDEDPFERLSTNGQRFVTSIAAQRQALKSLRTVAQDQVYAGIDAEVTRLAQVTLPFATNQVTRFGSTWNTTFRQLGELGTDPQFLAGLDDAFGAADGFFDKVNARIPTTGRALSHLFTGSVPFVNQFGDSLLQYVDDFDAWVDRSAANGNLDRFFRDAADQADALLDVSREVLVLVGRLGGIQPGSPLLRNMADAMARFNREAHSMQSVEGIIRTGNAAIAGLVDVLAVLGETLGDTLADPGTAAAVGIFFDVLKVGAQIVGALAQTFGMLPDSIQAVVLAGAALLLLGGRLATAFGKAHTAVGNFNGRLRDTGPAGARAADGLGRAEKAIGRVALAMVAAQVASAAFGSDLNPQFDALGAKLEQFGRTGQVAGEAARLFGDDMGKLNTALKDVADSGAWSDFARGTAGAIEGLTGLGAVFDDSLTKSRERISALDTALTDMVAAGGMDQARAAFDRIAESAAKQGVSTNELMKVLPSYAAAVEKARAAGDAQAQATAMAEQRQRLLTGSMQDAITTMGSYTRAWELLNGATLSSDEASLKALDALDRVKAAFKANTDTVSGNSRAAIENRVAVGAFAQQAADAAQKKYEETNSVQAATAVYDGYIGQLRKTLQATNLTDAQVEELIATYAQMPGAKATPISAPGVKTATGQVQNFNFAVRSVPPSKRVPFWASTAEATAAVNALKAKIDSLKSKKIYITGSVRWTSSGDLKVPGGTQLKDRWGGLHTPVAMAAGGITQAGIYAASNPPLIRYAEPETGGEAYIPKNGDPDRSISIGQRAMDWYGMAVVPKSVITAGWAANRGAPAMAATGGGHSAAQLGAAVATAVAQQLQGLGVYMDGREVGFIQGRNATILAR